MKRKTALLLILCMLLSLLSMNTFAASAEEQGAAEALYTLDLFKGTSATEKSFELDRALNRYEGYALLIRMLGAEEEAAKGYASGEYTYTFTDVAAVWVRPYVAYAQTTGLSNGIGGNQFGGTSELNQQMFVTMSLRALGYTDSGENPDFQWSTAVNKAVELGIISAAESGITEAGELQIDAGVVGGVDFSRGDTVDIFWTVLNTPMKGEETLTLADKLISEGVFTSEAFAKAVELKAAATGTAAQEPAAVVGGGGGGGASCSHEYKYFCNENQHWLECVKCHNKQSAENHSFVNGICEVCQYGCAHSYDKTKGDGICTKCGHECVHTFDKTKGDGVCPDCGYHCTHTYDKTKGDGVCELCGHHCSHANCTSVVTKPNCTEKGYTTHTCSDCGYTYKSDEKNALGHLWDEGTVTKNATTTQTGEKTFHCTRCTATKIEIINKTEYELPGISL